jgi:hypothetical protein
MSESRQALLECGFIRLETRFSSEETAAGHARELIPEELDLIGDFVLPPADAGPTRDFQTLHFDFGMPLDPLADAPVGFFTALFVVPGASPTAATRLVPVRALLSQRAWSDHDELIRRWARYGVTHGTWPGAAGYTEGSMARILEALADAQPILPSVSADPEFRCGLEFMSLAAERAFFARHGIELDAVEIEVALRPGELLIFDNLALAHGRRGIRAPGELRQWVFGQTLTPDEQRAVRGRFLAAFMPAA